MANYLTNIGPRIVPVREEINTQRNPDPNILSCNGYAQDQFWDYITPEVRAKDQGVPVEVILQQMAKARALWAPALKHLKEQMEKRRRCPSLTVEEVGKFDPRFPMGSCFTFGTDRL